MFLLFSQYTQNLLVWALLFILSALSATEAGAQIKWTRTMQGQNKVISFRPQSGGQVVYAAPHDSIGSIHVSWDGGYHWARIKGSQYPIEPNGRSFIRQIWLDPLDTNIVLAGSADPRLGVFRSSDAGYNWDTVIYEATILGESIFETREGSGILYCGSSGDTALWRSSDRGITWQFVYKVPDDDPNICVIACRPGSGTEFLAGSGGGYISKTTDAGKTWRNVLQGDDLGASDVPMIIYDPKNPGRVWATFYFSKDRDFAKSTDGGETWRIIDIRPNTWALEVDPSNPQNLWMGRFQPLDTVGGTFFRSIDGGDTWEDLGLDSIADIWQIDYDTVSGRLAMATSNGIFIGETRDLSVRANDPGYQLEASISVSFGKAPYAIARAPLSSEVEIFDINGRKLLTRGIVEAETRIELTDWPQGVYFAHFRHKNRSAIRRFTLLR